jgi:hypothetical protein
MTNFVPHAASPSPSKCSAASGSARLGRISPVALSTRSSPGLDLFLPGYDEMMTKVVVELVNGEKSGDREIANATGVQRAVVEHVFDVLVSRNLVRVTRMSGPNSHVFDVSPQLKRMLQTSA